MNCPFCGASDLKVVDKRDASDQLIRRRRECNVCHKRFTTYEYITESEIYVVKRNNYKEKFNKEKLKHSLLLACKKRPITMEEIEYIVSDVENILRREAKTEYKTEYVGNLVLSKLRSYDEVAYIRFASIFKNFDSIDDFKKEILNLGGI